MVLELVELLDTDASVLLLTVILQVALRPFSVLAVIVTVPAFFAVTFPLLLTVATFSLLEYQLTLADSGDTVATKVFELPTESVYFE